VLEKGYEGVDIDFEFLPFEARGGYIEFTRKLSDALHEIGKILVIAVPPKTSDEQEGLLVEGIDYAALGENADYILSMTYEYGYKFGPAMAIAPINQVRLVLDYAITRIPNEKLLLGISNYGYDWTLPFVRGESDAPSLSTVEAIELAKRYGSEIMFDDISMAPYFFYTDEEGRAHEVWFEDARSFKAKIDLIEEYNLAGGFIWDLMRDNPQGYVTINSLVKIK
ncbi:MAG: glycoside hydrolase, partial [Clostridia bacterium]|nr:glycoside hydrolase [Clostridia bacterium]